MEVGNSPVKLFPCRFKCPKFVRRPSSKEVEALNEKRGNAHLYNMASHIVLPVGMVPAIP